MQLPNRLTTTQLRTLFEQALAEEEALEKAMMTAEQVAADNTPEHIKAFHAAESEYMASWGRTADAYLAWETQRKWEGVRAA
jgi:hypothetical protein